MVAWKGLAELGGTGTGALVSRGGVPTGPSMGPMERPSYTPERMPPGPVLEAGLGLGVAIPWMIGAVKTAWPWLAGLGAGAGLAGMLGGEEPGTAVAPLGQPGVSYGVPFGGPGLAEPGKPYLLKEWKIRFDSKEGDFNCQYYLTENARGTKRIFMYNQRTQGWKSWPLPRLAVIGKNMPSHQMITRLRRNLMRHSADAVTILKLTAPNKLESTRRPGGRWVRSQRRTYKD